MGIFGSGFTGERDINNILDEKFHRQRFLPYPTLTFGESQILMLYKIASNFIFGRLGLLTGEYSSISVGNYSNS